MNKILGYIAVFLVFSWVTTANAMPVASITNSNGLLTIKGFSTINTDGDTDPSTTNFFFDFKPGQSGMVDVIQAITMGTSYHIDVGWDFVGLKGPFSASFDIVSLFDIPVGSAPIDAILSSPLFFGKTFTGTPLGTIVVNGNLLDLIEVVVNGAIGDPKLTFKTKEPNGQTSLQDYLNSIDNDADGRLTDNFIGAHAEVSVPEPAALLLFGGGLCMFGFSKKRA